MYVDLPAMLGPVSTIMRRSSSISVSLGTKRSTPESICSITGCLPSRISRAFELSTTGRVYFSLSASSAKDEMTSIRAAARALPKSLSEAALTVSLISTKRLYSSVVLLDVAPSIFTSSSLSSGEMYLSLFARVCLRSYSGGSSLTLLGTST